MASNQIEGTTPVKKTFSIQVPKAHNYFFVFQNLIGILSKPGNLPFCNFRTAFSTSS